MGFAALYPSYAKNVASHFAVLAEKAPRNDGADMAAILTFP